MPNRLISLAFIGFFALSLIACGNSGEPDSSADEPTSNQKHNTEPAPSVKHTKRTTIPTVYWAKPGFAPLFIIKGPFKEQGLGDEIFKLLQQQIPNYNHVNTEANYPRIITEMRKGTDMCAILHHNEERAEFMYFSKPVVITPSYQVYVSKQGRKVINERFGRHVKSESFDTLLSKSEGLNMAITPKQSYGPDRDQVVEKYKESLGFTHNFTEQTTLMKRLAADRIDIVLAFPWVFNYELDLLGLHSHISKVHLDDMPTHQVSNIGCAKTPAGKHVIESINNIQPSVHELLEEVVVDWLTPQEVVQYRAAYADFFEGDGSVH